MESKKELFKVLIKEFQGRKPPRVIRRDLRLPGWWLDFTSNGRRAHLPALAATITGPRRCGKTYLLFQIMEHLSQCSPSPVTKDLFFYINFEDDRLLPITAADLPSLLDAYYELYPDNRERDIIIFLDEVQHIEGWDLFIRRLLDEEGIRVFVTGASSKIPGESLLGSVPGRSLEIKLMPLSFREFLAFKGVPADEKAVHSNLKYKIRNLLDEYILYGGYPEVVLNEPSVKSKILKNYYDILVYKDLVEGYSIRNVGLLKGILKHFITHVGAAVSINAYFLGLAPQLRVSRETILEYISYLERNDLVSLVPIFSDSDKVRQVNPRKIYSLDNGIRNAVSFNSLHDENRLVKNLVFQKLRREGCQVYYWKDRGEVDFVAQENSRLCAVNVAYGRGLNETDADSLLELGRAFGMKNTELTIITKETAKTVSGVRYVPLWEWLLEDNSIAV